MITKCLARNTISFVTQIRLSSNQGISLDKALAPLGRTTEQRLAGLLGGGLQRFHPEQEAHAIEPPHEQLVQDQDGGEGAGGDQEPLQQVRDVPAQDIEAGAQ